MTDAEQILAILATFYLLECLYWVRPGAVVFVSQLGGRHRAKSLYSSALLRNDHGGLLFGNLLPWGNSTLSQAWPFSISPDGCFAYVAAVVTPDGRPDSTERFYPFEEITSVETDGKQLFINGDRFVTVSSASLALHLADLIRRVQALPVGERAAAIEQALAESTDPARVRETWAKARRESSGLRMFCSALFLFVFVGVPLLLYFEDALRTRYEIKLTLETWFRLVLVYFALVAVMMLDYFLAHHSLRKAFPKERRKQLFTMMISPADAMHARDNLLREVLEAYHPLALAAVLSPAGHFRHFARQILLDLQYPLRPVCPSADPRAVAVESWYRERLALALFRLVQKQGADVPALLAPPPADGRDCRTYCPRCRGQFVLEGGNCTACELPLCRLGESVPPLFGVPPPEPEKPAAPPPEPAPAPAAAPPPAAATSAPRPQTVPAKSGKKGKKKRRKSR